MNSPKLLEAIAELEGQRAVLDAAILHMRKAYEALSGTQISAPALPERNIDSRSKPRIERASFVNEVVDAITAAGHELHITEIVSHIATVRGEAPARTSVEASLAREMTRAKEANRAPRVVKTGRSTFDVFRSPSQATLSIAS